MSSLLISSAAHSAFQGHSPHASMLHVHASYTHTHGYIISAFDSRSPIVFRKSHNSSDWLSNILWDGIVLCHQPSWHGECNFRVVASRNFFSPTPYILQARPTSYPLEFVKNLRCRVIVRRDFEVQPVGIASWESFIVYGDSSTAQQQSHYRDAT